MAYLCLVLIALLVAAGAAFVIFAQQIVALDARSQAGVTAKDDAIKRREAELVSLRKTQALAQARVPDAAQTMTATATHDHIMRAIALAADSRRAIAVGKDGIRLRLVFTADPRAADLTSKAIAATRFPDRATLPPELRTALNALDTGFDTVATAETEITREGTERQELARAGSGEGISAVFSTPYFNLLAIRIVVTVLLFFLLSLLVSVYRYTIRMAVHHHARADALALSEGRIDLPLNRLVPTLDAQTIDFAKDAAGPNTDLFDGVSKLLSSLRASALHPRPVLPVPHQLQPRHRRPVQLFLDGDMAHPSRCRRPVPVLLAGRKPHHVAGEYLLHRPARALHPPPPGGHDQRLPQRMRMPRRSRPGLERHQRAGHPRWRLMAEQRVHPHRPDKPLARPLARSLAARTPDLHHSSPCCPSSAHAPPPRLPQHPTEINQ